MKRPPLPLPWLHRLVQCCMLVLGALAALGSASSAAESIVHQGPVLDIQVQRGEERLPLFLVPRLQRGDRLLVRPEPASLAQGDWILMLGLISPAGNQVQTQAMDLRHLEGYATLEIGADEQAPVIVLAPQLRNLFGLYTSFAESGALLDQIIQSDPQRFYDLQRLDEVNQAISALAQGLDQAVFSRQPQEAMAATRALALKFGVSQIDPECFRNNAVNTQCVAVNIVASKDFVLPSSSELGLLAGGRSMSDLTGFLTEKVKVFSDAGDFLSNKFRDQYDFAASFGRREGESKGTRLFSLTRFRRGNIKTAYVYVPSWFRGKPPTLAAENLQPVCLSAGTLAVQTRDRMPVVNYWHSWHMAFSDPVSGALLGETTQVRLASERGSFSYQVPTSLHPASGAQVTATLLGRFGFEPAAVPALTMVVPSGNLANALDGANGLVAGESHTLQLRAPQASCVQSMALLREGTVLARSQPGQAALLQADLRQTPAGPLTLQIDMPGAPSQRLALQVLPPRARVQRVEHTELDEHLLVSGTHLTRIAHLQLGSITCQPAQLDTLGADAERLRMDCDADIRRNASLPDSVQLQHLDNSPPAQHLPLHKLAAAPRVRLAPNANALLVRSSVQAQRWGLAASNQLMSDDSGLNLLLQATDGYVLDKGSYSLQLRFADDPQTARTPIRVPLMVDLGHQELRTRQALRLQGVELPTVVNPLEYRVVQDASGLAGECQPLQRAVLMLPTLGALSCAPTPGHWWLQGKQLNLIDAVGWREQDLAAPQLQSCPEGLCLLLAQTAAPGPLSVRLHWVREALFSVDVGSGPHCPAP